MTPSREQIEEAVFYLTVDEYAKPKQEHIDALLSACQDLIDGKWVKKEDMFCGKVIGSEECDKKLEEYGWVKKSELPSIDDIWNELRVTNGCKKSGEDCYFSHCTKWANCTRLATAIHKLISTRSGEERGNGK